MGEIEAVLERHPAIEKSVVIIRDDLTVNQQIVAYLIGDRNAIDSSNRDLIESKLRRYLELELPYYMIPNAFIFLKEFPLNINGKLERKALPKPELQTKTFIAPRNDLEVQIAAIWQNILQLDKVSINDNFFDLGGNSLSATRVNSRSGQDDIIVGVPIANRNRTEIEALIGFFSNTLVLRSDLADNPSFKQLLAQIKELTYGAYDHQDLPFEKLVEELQPERDLSYNPLFQAKFRLENQSPSVTIPGLKITPLQQTEFAAKLDLSLDMYETPSGLVGGFEYNSDLFKPETISRLVEHWRTLLQGIASNPDCRISELTLLTETERQQRLVDWNDTEIEFQQNLCFQQIFEDRVAKTPDNIALVLQEELTYRELDRRSNELAAYLSSLGVKSEVRVGICCDRSFEMIIAFLAVLKAGGAYVPLDPVYPQERLNYIVEDSQISILLTQTKHQDKFSHSNLTLINLDSPLPPSTLAPLHPLTSAPTPDNLAYIIYTSGSTGKPKGVLIPHRGLTNLTEHKIRTCQVNSNSCVLQFFSFSFDASIPEIIMSLGCGAKLCLASPETLLPGEGLLSLMRQQKVTYITITPSALAALPAAELPDLKMVLVGGEAPSEELIKQWSQDRL